MKYLVFSLITMFFIAPALAAEPSQWGAGDEAGASNHITPAKVLDAVSLITTGEQSESH